MVSLGIRIMFVIVVVLIFVCSSILWLKDAVAPSLVSVNQFRHIKLGDEMPLGPGDGTFAPQLEIPISKFYVNIIEDQWCVLETCGSNGAYVQTMGGWLEMEYREQAIGEIFDLDWKALKPYGSITFVGDKNAKIVGIYPGHGIKDLLIVLERYPELADFRLLNGVEEFGPLRLGEMVPLKPGAPSGYKTGELTAYPFKYIPLGKKFYVYSFSMMDMGKSGYCAFYECLMLPERTDYVEELGGWFSNDRKSETIRLFGLDPTRVLAGGSSLVVVSNQYGVIEAIHPNKTMEDIISILKQLPELADVERLYTRESWLSEQARKLFE